MGRIVAIGGGELRKLETILIDEYIVNLSNKKNPKALFIPTASHEPSSYIELFNKIYGELGCITDILYLLDNKLSEEEIKNKIFNSDIIYVGGGDTKFMLDIWKEKKVDIFLKQAFEKKIILSGLSAGSICWFDYGHSDSSTLEEENQKEYTIIKGLGLISGIHCPHYNENSRLIDFTEKMKFLNVVGIALEDNCAIEINDDEFKIIKSNNSSKAYKIYNRNGNIIKEEINYQKTYSLISELYNYDS